VTRSFKKVQTQFSATPRLRANGHLVASIVIRRCALAVGIAVLAACAGREEASRPPNVIVVLVDDLRWDDIGIAGHPFVETPAIDRLAREGSTFLNAFATTPLCSPSRAAILTGQYVHTNGIIDNTARDSASHRLSTFAIPMRNAGYETGFFGKWHMGNDDTRRPGWSHWVAMKGQGEAIDPNLNVDGERLVANGYVTDVLTDYVVNFMQRAREKPFLVFLAHKALHPNVQQRDDGSVAQLQNQSAGFIPAARHRGRYATATVPRRPNAMEAPRKKPALQRAIPGLPPLSPATGTPDGDVRDRLEMLLGVDESLARIDSVLTAMGERDNTIVVLTSDHGYFYGEFGLNEERRLAYEETIRIPLIVRYPKLSRHLPTVGHMAQTIDIAPTILSLAGISDTVKRHGTSLTPLIDGSVTTWRSSVLIEYYTDQVFPRTLTMGYQAVRTGTHKYIHYLELPGMDELYDLRNDRFEMDNLIGTEEGKRLLPTLQAELERLQRETGYSAEFKGYR
jgi:N-acetylglucosamine-6-sulfatase